MWRSMAGAGRVLARKSRQSANAVAYRCPGSTPARRANPLTARMAACGRSSATARPADRASPGEHRAAPESEIPAGQDTPAGPRHTSSCTAPGPCRLSFTTRIWSRCRPEPHGTPHVSTRREINELSDAASAGLLVRKTMARPWLEGESRETAEGGCRQSSIASVGAQIDHDQAERLRTPQFVRRTCRLRHAAHPDDDQRVEIDAEIGDVRSKPGAAGQRDPADVVAVLLCVQDEPAGRGEQRRGLGARQLHQSSGTRGQIERPWGRSGRQAFRQPEHEVGGRANGTTPAKANKIRKSS